MIDKEPRSDEQLDTSRAETSKERYERVAAELAEVCRKAGRDPEEVRLVAVSKTVDVPEVANAIAGGAHDFGENRPDLLMEKHDAYPSENWHFIGNIQSRRLADVVGRAALIHSLYDQSHARKIDSLAGKAGIVQDVLLEVNVSGEESKSGLAPADVASMVAVCRELPHVRLRGLMTMAPRGDLAVVRATFDGLRTLADDLRARMPADEAAVFDELSMGMSEDWREAVFAGATIVRIGRAIFSDQFKA